MSPVWTRLAALTAAGLVASVAGCSLTGLDRFRFPACPQEQCDALNARDGISRTAPATCLAWRCVDESGPCRYLPRDEDRDGHYAPVCEGVAGATPADDCDDLDGEVSPGNAEICNGADDDCDGVIDDAHAAVAEPLTLFPTTADPAWLRASDRADGVSIAYDDGAAAGFEVITTTTGALEGRALAPLTPTSAALQASAYGTAREIPTTAGCVSTTFSPRGRVPCATTADCPVNICEPAPARDGGMGAPDGGVPDDRRYCRFGPRVVCTSDADCLLVNECAQAPWGPERFCDLRAVSSNPLYPTSAAQCTHDLLCDNELFCDGSVECAPDGGEGSVDPATQCRLASRAACGDDRCDEARDGCVLSAAASCALSEVALAPAGDHAWFAPYVSESLCPQGALRVGYFADQVTADPIRDPYLTILQRGGDPRTTIHTGVDLADTGSAKCTGASRPSGAPLGAAGVVTASLLPPPVLPPPSPRPSRFRPQALVAYLAAPLCRELAPAGCSAPGATGPVDVEVIGVWLEEGSVGSTSTQIGWVNATGNGAPNRLGVAVADGARAPALASFVDPSGSGYVLAYPVAGGGLTLHVVSPFADPSPTCDLTGTRPCIVDASPAVTNLPLTSGAAALARTSEPLAVPAGQALFAGEQVVGDVQIALGQLVDGALTVQLAWADASGLATGTASVDLATGAITAGPTITRHAASSMRSFSIVHVLGGLRSDPAQGGGGFVLAWSAAGGTYAARYDDTGAPLAPGAARLGDPVGFPRAFVEMVPTIVDPAVSRPRIRVLGHSGSADAFVAFPAVCGAPL